MNVYMTEEEQVEQLKKWWNQYGNYMVTVILLVVLAIQGYRWYDNRQMSIKATASNAFNGLMDSVAKQDQKAIQSKANFLKENYQNTVYASSAALFVAKTEVENKQYDKAISTLNWVKEHAQSKTFQQLAQLRLARVYLFKKQYQQAISALNVVDEPLLAPLIYELKGDVFLAKNNKKEAQDQYQLALTSLPNPALAPPALREKLNRLSDQHSQLVNQTFDSFKKHS